MPESKSGALPLGDAPNVGLSIKEQRRGQAKRKPDVYRQQSLGGASSAPGRNSIPSAKEHTQRG